MLNLLRFIVVVVTGLIVFGWSIVAGQIPKTVPSRTYASYTIEPPLSRPVFGASTLPPLDLATPTTVRRPRFEIISRQLVLDGLEFDSIEPIEPKLGTLANAKPIAAAALKAIAAEPSAAEPSAASRVVALTPTSTTVVNLRMLSQRIASHNLSVGAIEDQLRGKQYWDLTDLESITKQLEDTLQAKDLWFLYYRVLDSRQQRALGSIASWAKSIELLRQRLFEAQVATDVDHTRISRFGKEETRRRLAVLNGKSGGWLELAD